MPCTCHIFNIRSSARQQNNDIEATCIIKLPHIERMVYVWTKRAREKFNKKQRLDGVHGVCWNRDKILAFMFWLNIACNVFVQEG